MGQSTTVFVLLLAFVAVAFVQGAVQYNTNYSNPPPAYGQSRSISINNDNGETPNGDNTITISCTGCVPATQTITFYASDADAQVAVRTFAITPSTVGTVTISFANSGIVADFDPIANIVFTSTPATASLVLGTSSLYIGQQRNGAKVSLNYLPLNTVTATITSPNGAIAFTPSTFTWTPTSTKDQFFSFRALKLSSFGLGEPAQVAITLSGTNAAGYANVASQNLTIAPLALQVSATTPLVYGQSALLRVGEAAGHNPVSSLTVTPTSTGGIFTPSSVTLRPTNGSLVEQFFSVDVRTTGTLVINFAYAGGDADELARWSLPTQVNLTGIALLTFDSGVVFDSSVYNPNEWRYGRAELSDAPRADVVVTPSSPVLVFEPSTFAFSAAKSFVNYRYKAISIPTTTQDVMFTITGTDAANVVPIANQTIAAARFAQSTVLVPSTAVTLIPGQTSTTFTIGLTVAPTTGLTVIVNVSDAAQANKYTVTPSSFTFTSSSALGATFTVTAATGVTAPTPLQIRYYLAGADASNYVLDNSGFNIGTTTNYEIVVPDISGQVITTGERQGPFAVHVRAIPTTSFSILLESILVSEVGAAIIFEPAVLQFSPSVWTATFYVVGGQSVPSIYGFAAPVRYTIQSAAEAQLYSISGATSFEMDARGSSLQLFPYSTGTYNLNLGETSDTFYLYLRNAPISAASAVSVSLAIDGFTVTPSTLTWGVGENIKSFTVTAGSLPVESGSNLRIVQTNDGRNTVGYDGLSTTFSLEFVVGVDAEEGTYGISNSPLVKLTEVGVPSEPIAISRFGIYPAVSINLQAPGLTFNPSTVVFAAGETVKYFTYTAATPLLSATRVLFRVSGAGASSYNDWESDIAAPTLDGISDITINFISSAPVIFPGSVNYGYARISVPTANDVTVTPTASQGSGITFSPATFTFSGLTTVIPFEIRSTGATDSIDSMGPGGPTDIGTTVFFSISGTDAALYNPINPYKLATVVGLHAGFDSTSSSAVVDVWEHNAIELSGFLTSPATIVFWSTDPAVEIKPTSIVVQPESRIIDTFDVAYRASAPGLYQIYVNVSGVPQSALFGALAYTNFAILQVTKASVDIDIGSFSGVVEIGKAYPLQFAVSHEVGSVVVSPSDASGNIVFEPATLALSPGTPSGIIMATATKIIGGNIIYEIDITGDDVFDLADDSSRYYTISAVTGHDGPTCSVSSHNVNFGQSYTGFIKCEIPHVEDSITITPTAPFVTFSPASVTVLPGTKLVYFDMTSSPSVKATYIAAAVLGGDVEVPVVVAFSGPDFENVIDPAEDTIFSDDITLTLRTISSNVVSNAEFWGNTVSITYTVSTPVATNLVLTPTAQVAGLVFAPASITLTPGVSSAAFSLYLDPVVLYNINPVDPVWSFQYTVAVTGGDADATSCGSNCVGSFTVTPRTVTIPNPPAVSGYNIKSADWTITLPVAAPSGLTLKPVSSNSEIEFTPAAGFVFAAGEITKTVTYKVKSDANGEYKYPSTQVDLAIGGADRLFFGLDTFESYTLSFTSADGQYAVVASLSSSSVNFGQPFTIQLRLTATKANIDVTEVVVTPSVNGGSFTPAFVTLSAAQPFATVTGIVANLSSALNIFGAGSQEDKQIFYAISGADAIKFSPVAASTISVYRYEIAVAAAPVGNLLAGRKYGPYTITVPSTARIVDSLTVSLNGPQGFEFTPAASFVLGENNRNVVFWVESSLPYSASAQITLAAEGPAADYFTFENQAWWVGGVDKRTITPPAITSVSTRATFYSFSFLHPIAEELTITPAGDNLVFEPAVIALAAGQTSAAFSVRTTGVSNTVITYTLGGSDALYYSPLTASPVSVDLSGYSLTLDVYQVGRVGTINIYAGSNAPRSYVTVVPHSKYTTFTPSVINITAGLEDIFFSFEITGNKADYVWFTYEGPDAALFARSPLAPFMLSVQRASIGYSPAAFWTTAFKVGVPSAGVATLNPIALPAAGQTVTFTPVSAALEFSPATWTFDAETSQVAFTATAKYAAATASVFFTVDDDENFNVPAVQTISASAVGFVSSAAPSDVFPATIAPGTTIRKTITLDAPIDVIITPVIVGPITVSPAVWDFTNTKSIVVTVTAGNNMGVYSRNAYVSFSASGADVASLNTASLAPKAIAVSSSQTISIPTGPIALVPGQVVTRVVKFSDAAVIPQGEVTVLMKTTGGVVVTPASVVLDKDNQWASFTITLDDGAASVVNNPQILFYAEWAGEDRHYAIGTNSDFGEVAISVTLASFTLPTFTSSETWTVGARVGPFTASIPYAAIADVTLTPSAKGLTFDPAVLTFSENDMFVDFYVTATELQSAASVWWTVGGSDAYAYQQPSPATINVVYNYFNLGSWSTYLGANNLLAGVASSPLNVHMQYPLEDPQATVTFTPVAAGLTFAPASFEFSNTAQSAVFTITAHNGIIGSSVISFTVDIDGDAQIATPVPLTATVSGVTSALQAITTTTTSIAYTIGSRQSYSVALKLPTPATSQLTVHASAPGVVFTDAVFAVGSTSALMSIVSAERAFTGNVVFTVSGTDASDYSVPNAISIVVTGKQFTFSSAFDALFVGVTSKKYTISATGAANGGAPSDSVTVTPWAAGVVFTPASFVFSSTTTSVDFTISVAAGAVSDNRVVHYTISGASAAEYAVIAPGSITVSTWTLSLSTTAISAPAGIPSSAVAVSLAASQPALTGEITVTPSAFGVVFTPASVTISGDKSSATFTATPTYITAAAVPVTFAITSAGDLAKYVAAPTATVNAVMRQMTTPADLGLNYVGVTSSSFVVSVDYLPVVAGNQVIVTPQAAGATFTPASFTFTSTSLPYATFTFSTSIVGATPTTDIAVNFLLTGSDAQFYAATASKYQSDLRPVAIVAGTSRITAGESTFVEFSTFHVPATGLTLSLSGGLTYTPASVTLSPTQTSARIEVSGGAPGLTYTNFYTLSGADASSYKLTTTSFNLQVTKYTFDHNLVTGLFTNRIGQTSAPFTIRINGGYAGQSVTLIPSAKHLVFTPSVFTFDANTQALTGTFTVTTPALQTAGVQTTVSWAVAGPAAAWFTAPASSTFTLATVATPLYSLTVPTGTITAYIGVESSSFRVYAPSVLADGKSITITPYVSGAPGVEFSPASATLTGDSLNAVFTVTTGFVGSATIEFQVSGSGANLFNTRYFVALQSNVRPLTIGAPASYTTEPSSGNKFFVFQKSTEYIVSLAHAPATGVTLTIGNPTGGLTVTPSTITFAAGQLTASYYFVGKTYNVGTPERLTFTLSGPDAQYYSASITDVYIWMKQLSLDFTVGYLAEFRADYGVSNNYATLTGGVLPSDITIDLSATAGFEVTPSTVTIPAGAAHSEFFNIFGVENGKANGFVYIQVSGAQAGAVALLTTSLTVATSTATYAFGGDFNSNMGTAVGEVQSVYVILSEPTLTQLTFRCESALFDIEDLVVPVGHTSATANAVATLVGATAVSCSLIGNSKFVLSGSNRWTNIVVNGGYFSRISTGSYNTGVGGWSAPVDFGLFSGRDASMATPNSLNVSFIVSPAGAAIIDPPALYIQYPASSFSFRVSPQMVGVIAVTPVLSGVDAELYSSLNAESEFVNSVIITGNKRSISVMTGGDGVVDRAADNLWEDSAIPALYQTRLIVGQESKPVTVFVGAAPTDLAIVLEAPGIVFNPSVLRFTGTYESLSFTMTATEAYGETATWVKFVMTGNDAALFNGIEPQPVYTHHKFDIPDFPILTINQPQTMSITLSSNFSAPVLLTPTFDGVVFYPEVLLFTPAKPTATFTVLGAKTTSSADMLNDNYNSIRLNGAQTAASDASGFAKGITPTQAIQFSWRYMSDDQSVHHLLPFLNGAKSINVLPAGFVVSFPHLQIGQTSTLTITATVAPRSDVVLTLVGNNLNFNPPNLLFTSSNPVATTAVTPVHADYQASQNIPFTVDYIISGTNQADFIPPAQSFLAVSRGTAPQADSMVLSAASPAAFASVFLLVASLIALLL